MLRDTIIHYIQSAGGRIPFEQFMELILYDPEEGYYNRAKPKLGKDGDFYTSAHVGAAMGQCIAARLHDAANELAGDGERLAIVEWGGGDGALAKAILDELRDEYPDMYERCEYVGAETSPHHRELQRERLAEHRSRIAGIVPPEDELIVRTLSERTSLVFANELLDAFPVHRLRSSGGRWMEQYVEWVAKEDTFRETYGTIADPDVAALVEKAGLPCAEGQIAEVSVQALQWLRELYERMGKGFVLLADYGDVTEELIAPHRMNGTLLCYRNHMASDDPFRYVGEQDMTAHVNFSWCMDAAAEAGFRDVRLTTQKQFLVEQGVLQRLRAHDGSDPFSPEARSNRAIRQLLLSDGMSELFKVLTMYKKPSDGR